MSRVSNVVRSFWQQAQMTQPLLPQVSKYFVPTFFGGGVVSRNSRIGKVSLFLNSYRTPKQIDEHVKKYFVNAAKTLIKTPAGREVEGVLPLYLELERTGLISDVHSKDFRSETEVEPLQQAADAAAEANHRAKPRVIIGLTQECEKESIDSNTLEAMVSRDEAEEAQLLMFLQNGEYVEAEQLTARKAWMDFALHLKKRLYQECHPDGVALPPEERHQKLLAFAQEMAASCLNGNFIFGGSYGRQAKGLEALRAVLSKIDPAYLPNDLQNYLDQGTIPTPEALVDNILDRAGRDIKNTTDSIYKPKHTILHPLFPDSERKLPDALQRRLPQLIANWLERWFKAGLIEDVRTFLPRGSIEFVLALVSRNGEVIENEERRKQFFEETKAWLKGISLPPVQKGMDYVDTHLEEILQTISQYIPDGILDAAEVDSLVLGGQFWLQFERQADGRFTVLVYSSGIALSNHPSRKGTHGEEIEWPLRFTNIAAEKLNEDFFLRLLQHHIEPQCTGNFPSHATDLFDILENYLQGEKVADQATWRGLKPQQSSWLEFTETWLTNPDVPQTLPSFRMHRDGFVRFCKGLVSEGQETLVLTNSNDANALHKAIKLLSKELQELTANQVLAGDEKEMTSRLIEEAKEALAHYHVQNGEGKKILEAIRDWILIQSGATMHHLQATRGLLCWMLGDEVGELLDAIVEITPAKEPVRENKGWLLRIWQQMTLKTLVKALSLGLWGRYAVRHPLSPLTLIPAAYFGVKYAPHPISDWYGVVVRTLFKRTVETSIQQAVHLLIKVAPKFEKTLDELEIYMRHFQGYVKFITEEIRGTREMDWNLLPAPPNEKDRVPLSLYIENRSIRAELAKKKNKIGYGKMDRLEGADWLTFDRAPQTASDVERLLREWIERDKAIYKLSYPAIFGFRKGLPKSVYAAHIASLPIPSHEYDAIWDHIKDSVGVIQAIDELARRYKTADPLVFYTLLAIQDKLCRKCLNGALKAPTNAANLFRYMKSATLGHSLEDARRLQALVDYFWPGLDHVPSESEILERYENSFFANNGVAERNYLEELFKDPAHRARVMDLMDWESKEKFNKYPELWGWLLYADAETPCKASDELWVPFYYKSLRALFQMAHSSATGMLYKPEVSYSDTFAHRVRRWEGDSWLLSAKKGATRVYEYFTEPDPEIEAELPAQLPKNWFQLLRRVLPENPVRDLSPSGLSDTSDLSEDIYAVIQQRPNQSKLLSDETMYENNKLDQALIFCEPSDQLIRMLAFLKETPSQASLQTCRFVFFRTGALRAQAKDSASLPQAIEKSLQRVLEYRIGETEDRGNAFMDLAIDWLFFTVEVMQAMAEQVTFPWMSQLNLMAYVDRLQVRASSRELPALFCLRAMLYPELTLERSPELRREFLLVLGQALFLNISRSGMNKPLHRAFSKRLCRWMGELQRELDTQDFRTELMCAILAPTHGRRAGLRDAEWRQGLRWVFHWNRIQINLWSGEVLDRDIDMLATCRNLVRNFAPEISDQLECHEPGVIMAADGSLRIEYTLEEQGNLTFYEMKLWRKFDGTLFRWVSSREKVQFACPAIQLNGTLWLEETEDTQRKLRTSKGDVYIVRMDDKAHRFELHSQIMADGRVLKFVNPKQYLAGLGAVLAFCHSLSCWTDEEGKQVKRFQMHFGEEHLTFDIKEIDGQLRAICEQSDPEDWIAPIQADPVTEGLGACLILENRWQRRLITYSSQYVASGLERLFAGVGVKPGPRRWLEMLTSQFFAARVNNRVRHEFKIEPDGYLTSEKSESMVYLLLQYLLQGKRERANRVAADLEMRCRMGVISAEASKALLPLALVPGNIEGLATIRQRLFAILEENQYIHLPTALPQADSPALDGTITGIMFVVTAIDLLKMDPENTVRPFISRDQELFLFLKLFRLAGDLIQRTGWESLSDSGSQSLAIGEAILLVTGFSPRLLERFKRLKKEFGGNESPTIRRLLRGLEIATNLWKAPGVSSDQNLFENALSTEGDGRRILRLVLDGVIKGTRSLDCSDLALLMRPEIVAPPLQLAQLNEIVFTEHFASYYSIARGDNPALRQSFTDLLPLLQGGWSRSSLVLVRYLQIVNSHSLANKLIFSTTEELISVLKMRADEYKAEQLYTFFFKLHGQTELVALTSIVVPMVAKKGAGAILNVAQGTANRTMRLINGQLDGPQQTLELAGASEPGTVAPLALQRIGLDSAQELQLPEIDDYYDNLLTSLYGIAFTMSEEPDPQPQVALLRSPDYPQVAARINQSLTAFYREQPIRYKSILKDKDSLWHLYVALQKTTAGLERHLMQERTAFLHAVNSFPREGYPFSFEELCGYLVHGDFSPLAKVCSMRLEDLDSLRILEKVLLRHIYAFGRLKQLQRAQLHLQKGLHSDSNEKFAEEVELCLDDLLAKRQYKPLELPIQQLRRFALYEMLTDKLLWKCQVDVLREDLANSLKELLMSYGKTSCIIPLKAAEDAQGSNIVVAAWPKGLDPTNRAQVSKLNSTVLHQGSQLLTISRSQPLPPERILALNTVLTRVRGREILHMTQRNAQALELRFFLTLHNLARNRYKKEFIDEHSAVAVGLKDFLRALRQDGVLNGDEPHEQFHPRKNELNYPVGPSSSIAADLIEVADLCMREVMKEATLCDLILRNQMDLMPRTRYDNQMILPLAKKLSAMARWGLHMDAQKAAFCAFITDQPITTADWSWITNHPDYRAICMVKGMVTIFIPLSICDKGVDRDYALSREGNGRYARPCEGASEPDEVANIRHPFEALAKTYITYYANGLSLEDAEQLITELTNEAKRQARARKNQTAQAVLDKILPDLNPEDWKGLSRENRNPMLTGILRNQEAISAFITGHVAQTIRYWEGNLSANAHNWDSMYNRIKRFHTSGTPYNPGCCPTDIRALLDPKTLGQAVDIAAQKVDGIHSLNSSRPQDILDEDLETYFKTADSHYTAIMDGPAYLKGLRPIEVAKRMAEFCREHRPDIQAIVFFQRDANREDLMMVLHVESQRIELLERCSVPPAARLTYFDERHCFGSDVPQKGHARALIHASRLTPTYAFMQWLFRFRGIKKWTKILDSTHEIDFGIAQKATVVMKKTDFEAIFGAGEVNLFTFLKIAMLRELTDVLDDNYLSYRQQIHNIVRTALKDKILAARSVREMIDLFLAFEEVFITTQKYDPIKMFGLQAIDSEAQMVAKIQRQKTYDLVKDSEHLTVDEKAALLKAINDLPLPALPSTVRVYTNGNKIAPDLLDLEQVITIEQSDSQESNQESDMMQEAQNQLESAATPQKRIDYPEREWPKTIHANAMGWMKFSIPSEARAQLHLSTARRWGLWGLRQAGIAQGDEPMPSLFLLRNAVADATTSEVRGLAKHFDERLWVSDNFLPLANSTPTEVGSAMQKPLQQVLIHAVELNGAYQIQHVGCLSAHEASAWRQKLLAQHLPPAPIKVFLYDMSLRKQVAGSPVNIDALKSGPDFLSLECQLNFIQGNGNYHRKQIPVMAEWLKKCGTAEAKRAFRHIFEQRSKGDIEKTTLHALFRTLDVEVSRR